MILRPLATSCAKDYKGHSLVQTSFTEPSIPIHRSLKQGKQLMSQSRSRDFSIDGSLKKGNNPSKHAGSDPEAFCLRPVTTVTYKRCQNRPGSYMPDPASRFCFSSISPKTAWIILRKTDPDPIWMAWSWFVQTHLVWKQAGVQESSGPVSGRTQPARYQFPTFRLGSVLPQTSRIIVCKTIPDPI